MHSYGAKSQPTYSGHSWQSEDFVRSADQTVGSSSARSAWDPGARFFFVRYLQKEGEQPSTPKAHSPRGLNPGGPTILV